MRLDARSAAGLALLTAGAMAASLALTGPASAVAPPGSVVFINEIHYDNASTDTGEAIEIAAPAGTDLSNWELVPYNGNGGALYSRTPLSGIMPGAPLTFGVVSFPIVGLQNGAPDGIALVGPDGVEQFLSYEGSFTATDGPADDLVSTDIGVVETGSEPIGQSLQLTGTGDTYGDFAWQAPAAASFGTTNPGQTFGAAPPPDNPPPPPAGPCAGSPDLTPISTLQGTTDVTPCAGDVVTVEGVVVGDYEGPSPALRGFYVQEQDEQTDADPLTSEGIFVFNASNDSVSLGQAVTVTGTAAEFQGQTQISATNVTVQASGQSVAPVAVTLPLPSATYLERFEGMLVVTPQTLIVTETFQLGRFSEFVVSSGDRLDQPTNVAEPGPDAQAVQAANDLNRLKIDDQLNNQNPDPILFGRNGEPLTAENTLRGGDTVTGAVGVMTYTWAGNSASGNAYRLRVVGDLSDSGLVSGGVVPDFEAANPRPAGAPEVGGSLQVAAFNVLNYFLTLDAGTNQCGPTGFTADCRGAETAEEFQRQRNKLISALLELDADVLGIIEVENTTGVEPLADIVAGLNAVAGAGTYAFIETGTVGTDVIKVGVIYQPGSVTPLGDEAVLDNTVDPRFNSDLMRPSVAQSFVENATGQVFTVVVNHFKSKGCGGATGLEADQGDGQGCWNPTRTAAAQALVDWLAGRPTGVEDGDFLIVGDLNSYAKEDPIDVLVEAGYVDLAAELIGEEAYSYVFNGQWGYLDYSLASPSLIPQVTGAAEYHINADEPSVLDYNTNFKSEAQQESLYAPDEFRTSDHDPVLVGLALEALPGATASAAPNRLWPPNHKYQRVNVTAHTGDGEPLSVSIVSVISSEPDCGGDFGEFCNDIILVDQDSVDLRAERYSDAGRT
ncbi:MAG: ExeM/NucH family extracellular endonuclease, partial [Actinomycetota bacterium]|nr:ExeM/NucH family extracellular endonuclease [Actinomycetota bacterium]